RYLAGWIIAAAACPTMLAAQVSIVSARLLVDSYDAIPLAIGEVEIVAYPPGGLDRAFASHEVEAEIPLNHAAFGGALPVGTHSYVIETEDSEGNIGRSARRVFRLE